MFRAAATDRRLAAVLALAFATSVGDASFLPLLPELRVSLGLSALEAGALLSAGTVAMLAAAVPIGLLARRVGPTRLLLACALLLPLALAAHALARGVPALLLARTAFGVAFAILWTVGPAVAAGNGRGAAGTGRLVAASGAGWLVGPLLAGGLANVYGPRVPFLAVALVAAVAIPLALAASQPPADLPEHRAGGGLRQALALTRRSRNLLGATAAAALLGVVTGVSGLLAPLVLAANGLSAGGIGAVVALSAVVWIVGGALSARVPVARIDLRFVGLAIVVLALSWLIPVASLSTSGIVGFLLASAAVRALLGSIVYVPARVAAGSEAAAAPVVGMMNVAWAAAALASPLAAGVVVGGLDVRVAFAGTALTCLIAAVWMLAPAPRRVSAALT